MNGQLFHQGQPVSSADLIAYLEMARIALDRDDVRDQIAEGMDLSDEELERLISQLNDIMDIVHLPSMSNKEKGRTR